MSPDRGAAVEPETIFVTGATGLVGSNTCRLAAARGIQVRALVRSESGTEPLVDLGVEIVLGDVTDAESIRLGMKGVDAVIHTAAVLGGTWSTASEDDFFRVNHHGSVHVLDAARQEGARCVLLSTYGMFAWNETITEESRPTPIGSQSSPYIRAKIATFYEGMARAAMEKQDVCFVVPGCIYGPSLFPERALDPTSFDGALLRALTGDLAEYLAMPILWSYADDVATVALAAVTHGRNGHRYLALGRPDDAMTLPSFCNIGAELAGAPYRVREEQSDPTRYGTMGSHASRTIADPMCDSSVTNTELGVEPVSVRDGLSTTVDWLRDLGKLT